MSQIVSTFAIDDLNSPRISLSMAGNQVQLLKFTHRIHHCFTWSHW